MPRCRKRESTMIDPKTNPGSEEHESIEHYDLEVAPRVRNLPPYLFGKINELKYRKRRAGIDVIDLGMGNPTDPPEEWVIDKLCEAARDSRNHRYSVATGVYNFRREVADAYETRFGVSLDPDQEVVATIGSKEGFSHMCLALLGPGDTALVPGAQLSDPYPRGRAGLRQRDLARCPRAGTSWRTSPGSARALSPAEDPGPQLSAQPDGDGCRPSVLRGNRAPGEEVPLLRHPRLRLRRHRLRRLPAAQLPVGQGGQERRLRVHDDVQGLQHGRLAGRLRGRQPRDARGAQGDQGLLRLRIFQAVQIAAIVGAAARRGGRLAQVAEYQMRRDVLVEV